MFKNVVAYMSIPTHNFCENVEPYLGLVDATYILEKPHGHSKYDFERIKDFIDENNLKVVYNDHYLGKDVSAAHPDSKETRVHQNQVTREW
jgi:glucose-6-phosphate 1-dehydrogenase